MSETRHVDDPGSRNLYTTVYGGGTQEVTQAELDAVAAAKQDVIPPGTYVEPASTSAVRISEPPPQVFLSPTGDDTFDGRWDRPKKTLAAAITAAAGGTVHVAGVHDVSSVAITSPVELVGQGMTKSELRNTTGTVLVLQGSRINARDLTVRSGGGAPAILQSGVVEQGLWERVRLIQAGNDQPIWDGAGFALIDMRFAYGYSEHRQAGTVPGWRYVAAGGLVNDNVWENWRAQYSGNYHWWVESNTANAHYSNTWRNITHEVCTGGGIKLIAVRDYLIENCPNWDMNVGGGGITTGKRHFFAMERNAAGISCVGTIRRQQRLAGTNDAGVFDISLPTGAGGSGTIIERCRNVGSADPYTIDLAGNSVLVMASDPPLTSFTNATAMLALANGRVSIGAVDVTTGSASPEGVVTAGPGSAYHRTTGAGAPVMYLKLTGTGNTGWKAVATVA